MKKWLNNIFYSFPLQLFILHIRSHLLLTFLWVLVVLLVSGQLAAGLGFQYLFLEPEYLGEVNALSFLLLGAGYGAFFMTWNLTCYVLSAHRFPFLASLKRPFTKFCINNGILPLAFYLFFLVVSIRFMRFELYIDNQSILINLIAFTGGIVLLVILVAVYFNFTNKDILSYNEEPENVPPNIARDLGAEDPDATLSSSDFDSKKQRVNVYLSESLRPRLVRSVAHYELKTVLRVYRQNHGNVLLAQLLSILVLIGLGYMIENPFFRIPAGTSIFIMFSIISAFMGALNFWFGRWQAAVVILILIGVNELSTCTPFTNVNHRNKAYGLDYQTDPAPYTYAALDSICQPEFVEQDRRATLDILENWKNKLQEEYGVKKPKMIFFTVSGGGLKSSIWTFRVMQELHTYSNGTFIPHTMLLAGASGGMIGSSYFRELYLQKQNGAPYYLDDPEYIDHLSNDLINPLAFTIVSNDLFIPWAEFTYQGKTYRKDRGYIFEKQLVENTGNVFDKSIAEYYEAEKNAEIPLCFITPAIVNDGRQLVISPHGVSYMMNAPVALQGDFPLDIDAVDFGRLLRKQSAYELRYATALRMNATYPYVLPNVFLPTDPPVEIMDSGLRDNDGTKSAIRFIQVFREWILENTSGIVLIQVNSTKVSDKIEQYENRGIVESLMNPLGIAARLLDLQHYEHDTNLGLLFEVVGKENIELIRFTYYPAEEDERASMSFHLTDRERRDVLNALYLEENQESLERVVSLLPEGE